MRSRGREARARKRVQVVRHAGDTAGDLHRVEGSRRVTDTAGVCLREPTRVEAGSFYQQQAAAETQDVRIETAVCRC